MFLSVSKNRSLTISSMFVCLMLVAACHSELKTNQPAGGEATDSSSIAQQTEENHEIENEEMDTTLRLYFGDFNVEISRLVAENITPAEAPITSDTVYGDIDLAETLEGQLIAVTSMHLIDIKVEQAYETSVSISNEGPHCDLIEWKHYVSPWETLKQNKDGQFVAKQYTLEQRSKFIPTSINEIRAIVNQQCGEDWVNLLNNCKKVNDYPIEVGISNYLLRISGTRIEDGKKVTRIIVLSSPLGC